MIEWIQENTAPTAKQRAFIEALEDKKNDRYGNNQYQPWPTPGTSNPIIPPNIWTERMCTTTSAK